MVDTEGKQCRQPLRADRDTDTTWVRCTRCREQYEIAKIEADARGTAEGQAYTIAELETLTAAISTRVPKRTMYRWARDRRMEPRGWLHADADGYVRITDHEIAPGDPRVYLLRDVLTLARRETRHPEEIARDDRRDHFSGQRTGQ